MAKHKQFRFFHKMPLRTRLSFYKLLLKECTSRKTDSLGLCAMIAYTKTKWLKQRRKCKAQAFSHSMKLCAMYMPELYKYAPPISRRIRVGVLIYWFLLNKKGWQRRIAILEKVVQDLEQELKTNRI